MAVEVRDPHHPTHVWWKLENRTFYHRFNGTKWKEMKRMHITPKRVELLYEMLCSEKLILPKSKTNKMGDVFKILTFLIGIIIIALSCSYTIVESLSLSILSLWSVFKLLCIMGIGIFVGIRIMSWSLKK